MAALQSLVLRSPEAASGSAAIAAANKREVGPATTTAAAPADPPLPAGWDTVVTEDGEQYFHFPSTGETTWASGRRWMPPPLPSAGRYQRIRACRECQHTARSQERFDPSLSVSLSFEHFLVGKRTGAHRSTT
jgi:hypothetical protein